MQWNGGDAQAAHFVGGRSGSVLLEERALRVCCRQCNVFLHGNYQAYTLKMIDEVGREEVERLLSLKNRVKKWSRDELQAAVEDYHWRLEWLKSRNSISTAPS